MVPLMYARKQGLKLLDGIMGIFFLRKKLPGNTSANVFMKKQSPLLKKNSRKLNSVMLITPMKNL